MQCMPFYADYFEIKYDLPKLDMIAVPHLDFGVYCLGHGFSVGQNHYRNNLLNGYFRLS